MRSGARTIPAYQIATGFGQEPRAHIRRARQTPQSGLEAGDQRLTRLIVIRLSRWLISASSSTMRERYSGISGHSTASGRAVNLARLLNASWYSSHRSRNSGSDCASSWSAFSEPGKCTAIRAKPAFAMSVSDMLAHLIIPQAACPIVCCEVRYRQRRNRLVEGYVTVCYIATTHFHTVSNMPLFKKRRRTAGRGRWQTNGTGRTSRFGQYRACGTTADS